MEKENTQWLNLEGNVCVITGAVGGIGQEIAKAFLSTGAKVAMLDIDGDKLNSLAAKFDSSMENILPIKCNILEANDIIEAKNKIFSKWGKCNTLVNNAGILRPSELSTISVDNWNNLLNVNLTGSLLCAQTFYEALKNTSGSVVHISSISGSHPQPYSGAYSASKAAILMLSQQLAFEWGEFGVRSNVVSPGMIRTPLSEKFYIDEKNKKRREAVVPLRRIGAGEDIANSVLFLASQRASYISGQEMVVDGGFSQTLMSHIPRPGYDDE